jgi:hypothetical protein
MPDRIYSYQQTLILQYIENLEFLLTQPFRNRRQIKELFNSLKDYTDLDPSCPDNLRAGVFLSNGAGKHWEDRVTVSEIKVWLIRLHNHYDMVGGRTAAR